MMRFIVLLEPILSIATMSIGDLGSERQLVNVAAGKISSDSTDAINGSQLYALTEAMKKKPSAEEVSTEVINVIKTKLVAGNNIKIDENEATNTFTVSAILPKTDENKVVDTNTQNTVSTEKDSGISLIEIKNNNGTTNYKVSAKLGEGLKIDENGNIATTFKPTTTNITGGNGVTVNKVENDYTIEVAGITTKTDDGKIQKRKSLQDTVTIKGDGKNIHTSTNENGDLVVGLGNNIKVDSVEINGGAVLNQDGLDMKGNRITNIAKGVKDTDAVNVRQLQEQGQQFNQKLARVEDRINKSRKRSDAGIAGVTAIANIPQVITAGKSTVGVGVGGYGKQTAIAVGYSRAADNGKHIFKISTGINSQSKANFGAGYSYQF